jgi:hypothetical protein|tara:strand:- start:404 stop:592 length:189 start_codon:yes stop_codon:yes gene_type:complete
MKLIKIILIIIIMCFTFLNVSANQQNIILESSNDFIDVIEPDVTIYKDGIDSPIFGKNLEFS